LEKGSLDWAVVEKGDDFSKDFEGKGFIINSRYNVGLLNIKEEGKDYVALVEGAHIHVGGGFSNPKAGDPYKGYALFCADSSGLLNPFSEIIPFSIKDRNYQAMLKNGWTFSQTMELGESFSEALSQEVGKRFLREEFGTDEFSSQIDNRTYGHAGGLNPYKTVSDSVNLMKRIGVQNAVDIFMENPEKYRQSLLSK
jgi:hypothetical protein